VEQLNLEELVESLSNGGEINVELFAGTEMLYGRLTCPADSRLSDLLNDSLPTEREARSTFLEFLVKPRPGEFEHSANESREYIRKSAIDFLAISDDDADRKTGRSNRRNALLFRKKSPVRVVLQLGAFTLIGDIHCSPGQTVHDVLNDDAQFVPLTDVTMVRDGLIHGARPFVVVNKREVISCREE
jgi:hypothetical protein